MKVIPARVPSTTSPGRTVASPMRTGMFTPTSVTSAIADGYPTPRA